MGELAEAGCVAFSQAEAPLTDTQVLLRALQYAATFGHRVWLRPQDSVPRPRRRRARRRGRDAPRPAGDSGRRRDDRAGDDLRAGPRDRRAACTCAGCRRREGVAHGARGEGARACRSPATSPSITCTCATSTSAGSTRSAASCRRCAARATATRCARALADGTIDVVCSDHTPVDDDAQAAAVRRGRARRDRAGTAAAADAQVGARGQACRSRAALARITSRAGARCSGVGAGQPRPSAAPADLCVFDPDAHWTVEPGGAARARARTRRSSGSRFRAGCAYTLVGGQVVFEGRTQRRCRSGRNAAGRRLFASCSNPNRAHAAHITRRSRIETRFDQDMQGLLPEQDFDRRDFIVLVAGRGLRAGAVLAGHGADDHHRRPTASSPARSRCRRRTATCAATARCRRPADRFPVVLVVPRSSASTSTSRTSAAGSPRPATTRSRPSSTRGRATCRRSRDIADDHADRSARSDAEVMADFDARVAFAKRARQGRRRRGWHHRLLLGRAHDADVRRGTIPQLKAGGGVVRARSTARANECTPRTALDRAAEIKVAGAGSLRRRGRRHPGRHGREDSRR